MGSGGEVFYAAIFDWGNSLLRKLASGNNNSDRVGPEHFIFTACRPCIAVRMWLYYDFSNCLVLLFLPVTLSAFLSRVTDENVPCIIRRTVNRRRKRSSHESKVVIITFDGFTPDGPSGSFIFVPDPTITAIEPNKVYFG